MRKLMGKVKQTLSILLVAAMVVTCIPQTGLSVQAAAETPDIIAETEASDVLVDTDADADAAEDSTDVSDEDGSLPDTEEQETPDGETGEDTTEDITEEAGEEPVEDVMALTDLTADAEYAVTVVPADETTPANSYTVNLPNRGKAIAGVDYTFTVTPATYYEIQSVAYSVESGGSGMFTAAEGTTSYTIPRTDIIGSITVTVTTKRILYDVITDIPAPVQFNSPDLVEGNKAEAGYPFMFDVWLGEYDEKSYSYSIDKVTYQFAGETTVRTPESYESIYVIPNVTGDFTITVTVKEKLRVTFAAESYYNLTNVNTIKVNNVLQPNLTADDDEWIITAYTGDSVSFQLTPTAPYKVTAVRIMGAVTDLTELIAKSGVYTIPSLEENLLITVETEFDPKQCYNLKVDLAGASEEYAELSAITKNGGTIEILSGETMLLDPADDDPIVKIAVRLRQPGEIYTIASVKKGTTVLPLAESESAEDRYVYEMIPFVSTDKGKVTTVTVTLEPNALEGEETKIVTFQNVAEHLTYAVTTSAVVKQNAIDTDAYDLTAGAKTLNFTITATGPYAPTVNCGRYGEVRGVKVASAGTGSSKTTTYTYSIPAKALSDWGYIVIDEEEIRHRVTIAGVTDEVDLVVSVDGQVHPEEMRTEEGTEEVIIYSVLEDTVVTIKATQRDNAVLKSITSTIGGKSTTKNAAKGTAELVVTANDYTGKQVWVRVTANGVYRAANLEDSNGTPVIPDAKGVYKVRYDGAYRASAVYGNFQRAARFTKAEILDGRNVRASWNADDTAEADAVLQSAEYNQVILIQNLKGSVYEGKTLTVNLYTEENGTTPAVTYKLQVYKPITSISTKSNRVTQVEDTTAAYPLIVNAGGDAARLVEEFQAEAENTNIVKSAIINFKGELLVTTGNQTGTTTVSITPRDEDSSVQSYHLTITVTPLLVSTTTAAPTVKLAKADDVSLTLTLTAPKNIAKPAAGEMFYEVVAEAAAEKENSRLKSKVIEYFAKDKDTQTQTEILYVSQNGTDDFGYGEAREYAVQVRLVYVTDGNLTKDNDGLINNEGYESSKPLAKPLKCSTLKPAWEEKLTLKKGATTVYTGQQNVVIATPQFTKGTTYTILEYATTLDASYDDKLLPDWEGNQISVSPRDDTRPGKYTIWGFAAADVDKDMEPASGKIDITVVKGIETLSVDIPTQSLYKAPKKAAVLKAVPIYNENTTAPKTKKVTWKIVKNETGEEFVQGDRLYGDVVKVSNGTVTVDKDYIISQHNGKDTYNGEDTFVIQVTAADYAGNTTVGYSQPITITNKGASIQSLALVKQNENGQYDILAKVIDKSGKVTAPLTASDVNGAFLAAFTGGILETDTTVSGYELSNQTVPVTNLTMKSSAAKKVDVNAEGRITVIEPANNVKLSVAANDGSGKKMDITINIGYDEAPDLILKAEQFTGYENEEPMYYLGMDFEENAAEYGYGYIGSTLFKLTVLLSDNGEAPAYTNYTVTAKGAKVLEKNGNEVLVATTAETAAIELTNKANGKKQTYTLKNTDWSTAAIPSVSAEGSFHEFGTYDEQTMMLKLNTAAFNTLKANAGQDLYAWVEVDWSARTAANAKALEQIAEQIFLRDLAIETETIKNVETPVVKLEAIPSDNTVTLTPGSYKLKVTIGIQDAGFKALTKTVSVTVKVDAAKAFTFTPAASYTIAAKDNKGVALTAKSTAPLTDKDTVEYELYNANIKGEANHFTDYFEISDDGTKIQLKKNADIAKLATKEGQQNLTGHLEYIVILDAGYYTNSEIRGTIKITMKVDPTGKKAAYAVVGKPEINMYEDSKTTVALTANKEPLTVAYAMAETPDWAVTAADDGSITVTALKQLRSNASNTVKVWIVPGGSFYADKFKGIGTGAEALDTYKAYGIPVSVSIKSVDKMTVEQAKARVEAWIASVNNAETPPAWLNNDLTVETLLEKAWQQCKLANNIAFSLPYSGELVFEVEEATESAPGRVRGNFLLWGDDGVDDSRAIIPYEFTIPRLTN